MKVSINTFLFIALLVYIITDRTYSQAPDTLWTKTFGVVYDIGSGSSVQETTDSGYILTGTINDPYPNHNAFLIKTNKYGNTEWFKTFGEEDWEGGNAVLQTAEGGYIVLANTYGSAGRFTLLIKTNELGDTTWTKLYETGIYSNECFSIQQTSDGGYIMTGFKYNFPSGNNIWLIKTDQNGDIEWTQTYGGDGEDVGYSVQQTIDGGFIIAGSSEINYAQGLDLYIIRTNEIGSPIWTKAYGWNTYEAAKSIKQTSDSGYIVVGRTDIPHSTANSDIWLLRLNQNGDTSWTKTYGGINNDVGNSIIIAEDGNYVIIGTTASFGGGNSDIWLLKINQAGDTLWTKTLGSWNYDEGNSIQATSDQGYIITGIKESIWLVKTAPVSLIEPNGGELWYMGQEQMVSWKSEYVEYLKIELSDDSGLNWTSLSDSTQNNGTYSFLLNPQIPSTECLIKISNIQDSSVYDISDSVFTIGAISVISPNGGEFFMVGDTINISWFSAYMENVSIKLSLNNGFDWLSIIDSITNSGSYNWIVSALSSSEQCLIKISDLSDSSMYDVSDEAFTIELATSAEHPDKKSLTKEYIVNQNFPNPVNPSTSIKYQIPELSLVRLIVYDVLGNEIATLVNEVKSVGTYEVEFDGSHLPSGVYFYKLQAGSFVETKKMVLMK